MNRLRLEQLLESGLEALGSKLKEREYYEDIVTAAAVDDVIGNDSIESYEKKMNSGSIGERIGAILFSDLSRTQFEVHAGVVPFFKRVSEPYKGVHIDYRVYSTDKREKYSDVADDIVEQGKIEDQCVYIHVVGDQGYFARITIEGDNPSSNMDTDVEAKSAEDFFAEPTELVSALKDLHNKIYDPDEVYGAVMKFLIAGKI